MSDPHQMNDLARYFQAQHAGFTDDLELYLACAREYGGPILELGCGSGRILVQLAQEGFQVVGVDQSRAMLQRLSYSAQSLPDIQLVQAKLESMPLLGRFQLILSPCSTLAYLDQASVNSTLKHARRLMAENGRLVLDLPAPHQDIIEAEAGQLLEWFHEPERSSDVQVSADQRHLTDELIEVDWHYDEMLQDGKVQRQTFRRRYHMRSLSQMKAILAAAGFSSEQAFGDYEGTAYSDTSVGLIILAKPI
jgi:SAM-dependent methyltransferase